MTSRRSRAETFISRSTAPVTISVVSLIFSVAIVVGSNSRPRIVPSHVAVPLFVVLGSLTVASLFLALNWRERRAVSRTAELAALRRIRSVLRLREPDGRYMVLDRLELDVHADGRSHTPRPVSVDLFVRGSGGLNFRSTLIVGRYGAGKSTLLAKLAGEIADQTASGHGSHFPLYASALSWESETHFSRWIEKEMIETFGIRPRIANAWIHSGRAILFVDDLDVVQNNQDVLRILSDVAGWQNKPSGGKSVLALDSANQDVVDAAIEQLKVDRFAELKPLEGASFPGLIRSILKNSELFRGASATALQRQTRFLSRLVEEGSFTASSVQAVDEGSSPVRELRVAETAFDHEVASQLEDADEKLANTRSWEEALDVYLKISQLPGSYLAALAAMRATLVQAGLGNPTAAQAQFERAIDLFNDLNPLLTREKGSSILGPSEMRVLRLLQSSRPLLEEEVLVKSGLLPSITREALEGLITKGFASSQESGKSRIEFYQSATDAVPSGTVA